MTEKQEKKEQPIVRQGDDDDDEYSKGNEEEDDDEEESCLPCLSCWQIIAIGVVAACVVIVIVVAAVVLLVTADGDSVQVPIVGGSDSGGNVVDFPPDTVFRVEVQNQYDHGTLGGGTYEVSFDMKEGDTDKDDADPNTTDIKAYFIREENGLARLEVTLIIDFDSDGQVDCNQAFYASVDINSDDFGGWTTPKSCTYTLGGIYQHKTRVKVTSM